MGENESSIFYGGLPPKRAPREGSPTAHRSSRRRVLIVAAGIVISAGIATTVALELPQLAQTSTHPRATAATLSPAEQQAVDAGGAAVPGHQVSRQLCDAVQALHVVDGGDPESYLKALTAVAEVESPYQAKYEAQLKLETGTLGAASDAEVRRVTQEFASSLQADTAVCA